MVLTTSGLQLQANNGLDVGCPTVSVSCASEECHDSPLYLKAQISEANPEQTFSFQWKVSSGRIVEGQGTASIKVEFDSKSTFTATVEIKGIPAQCAPAVANYSVLVESLPPVREVAEFGSLPFPKVQSRFDDFANQLRNEPGALGYIISSGKWPLADRAKQYLKKYKESILVASSTFRRKQSLRSSYRCMLCRQVQFHPAYDS